MKVFFDRFFLKAEELFLYIKPNISLFGWIGMLGFILYYFIWEYVFPQAYENFTLRICIGVFLYGPWVFFHKIPFKWQRLFPLFALLTLFVSLPYFFSFMLFKNAFSPIWMLSFVANIYLFSIFIYDFKLSLFLSALGFLLAYAQLAILGQLPSLNLFPLEYIPVIIAAYFSAVASTQQLRHYNEKKVKSLRVFSSAVTRQLSGPLSMLRLSSSMINRLIDKYRHSELTEDAERDYKMMNKMGKQISEIYYRTEMVASMINRSLKQDINSAQLKMCSMGNIIKNAVESYSYDNKTDRARINYELSADFIFKGDEQLMLFVLFNLMQNAFKFLDKPESKIQIWMGDQVGLNTLHVRDNGKGIREDQLPFLFNKVLSNDAQVSRVGLGLAFSKNVIEGFGGRIKCNSKWGIGTEIIMHFPKVNNYTA